MDSNKVIVMIVEKIPITKESKVPTIFMIPDEKINLEKE